jgi:hypothetical protein
MRPITMQPFHHGTRFHELMKDPNLEPGSQCGASPIRSRPAGARAVAAMTLVLLNPSLADIHVAPQGRDDSPGTREQPLATLNQAVAAARALPAGQPRRIVLRSGSYWNVSVVLGPEDSGLTIEAEPGGTPILHGGQRLTGWAKDGDRLAAAPLPDLSVTSAEIETGLALPRWEVRLLLINGQSRPRARFPEEDTLRHQTTFDVSWMSTTGGGWQRKPTLEELTTLRYRPGDLPAVCKCAMRRSPFITCGTNLA